MKEFIIEDEYDYCSECRKPLEVGESAYINKYEATYCKECVIKNNWE